jgi:hypothetical protein
MDGLSLATGREPTLEVRGVATMLYVSPWASGGVTPAGTL